MFIERAKGGKSMAEVKIVLSKEEAKEKEMVSKVIRSLNKRDREKLKGFLEGVAFFKGSERKARVV